MSGGGRTVDDDLSEFGVATVGIIDSKLIEKAKIRLPAVQKRHIRQTELEWTSDCDAVVRDFETRLKPNIAMLSAKTCQNRRFVYFHEYPIASGIYRAHNGVGKHTVAIEIRDGSGLPHICKGSHKLNELDLSAIEPPSISPSCEGSVLVFDASISREDPPVKDKGWAGILLLYGVGNAET